ncbi:T9SS type A sorting domain-containing protein [Chryseobacterium paridis]|uniref:T9SS type A sorting domain-containing protein n=1 Tax=Chryseobacterium paridis TaxID=2800328 RepID=A0ABS1FZA9_9FLAO|nr:T9SS type A sorting domain-containing protein [Chryseobacterium paridis]MBK1897749.1 T9SS type A sorting domain-containing protein [Chryseobacterium paridis]
MYKLLFTFCVSFSCIAYAQNLNFTDSKFKALLLGSSTSNNIAKDLNGNFIAIDSNGDGQIQLSEAQQVKVLNIQSIGTPTYNNLPDSITDATLFPNLEELYVVDSKSAIISFVNNNVIKKVVYMGSGGFTDISGTYNSTPIDFSFDHCSSVQNINDFVTDINASPYNPSPILRYKNCPLIKDNITLDNKRIKALYIENCNVKTLTFISCKYLEKISIPNTGVLTKIEVLGTNITGLSSDNQNIELIANDCTNLEEVIADTDHYNSSGAYFTSANLNGCVSLKRIKGLNSPSINFSNSGLINLEELDASFYNRYDYYTTSGVSFGNVTSLNLSGLPKLKVVKVFNQPIIGTMNFSVANTLENIDITNSCGYATVLNISNLPNLHTLKADIPNSLNSSNIPLNLQQINAQNCTALANLKIGGNQNLKNVNLQNCSSIETLYFGNYLPGNISCPELNTLNINQCTGLKELGFSFTKIASLDLSQCPLLELIEISNNSLLASINTSQSTHLKNVTLNSNPLITSLDLSNSSNLQGFSFDNMPGLTYLNIKNGSLEEYYELSRYNQNLAVCVDANQLTDMQTAYPDINFTTNCNNVLRTRDSKVNTINRDLHIFPNPVKDFFQLKFDEPIKNVKIFDSTGRVLLNQDFNKTVLKIDISDYAQGIYTVKIKTNTSEISKKLLKD